MKVKDLIAKLEGVDGDMPVLMRQFMYDSDVIPEDFDVDTDEDLVRFRGYILLS